MEEEEHNQPKISPKRIKFEEITEKEEEDRISGLPDCLVLEILSRLPSTREAIKTGTLSKRWKLVWTWLPTLIFKSREHNHHWSDFVSFVDKTLTQCRQLKLKKCVVYAIFDIRSGWQVNNWIRYAIRCNVEELNLAIWSMGNGFSLDQSFFINTCFTHLTLSRCMFNPIGAISWKNLRSLCICYANLDEDLIENILSGSPLLETLVLNNCYGYNVLDITSKSVKKLVLNHCYGCRPFDIVELKAPNISSMIIKGHMYLLLVNVSSLVEAKLDYTRAKTTSEEEEMFKRLILSLRHVKELEIAASCLKVLSRLEAKGFVFPPNMKFPDAC